jgi:hypothetical protein
MSYPSLSESYWMDFEPTAPEWVCIECVKQVFADADGDVRCAYCGDDVSICTGEVWESITGESWH